MRTQLILVFLLAAVPVAAQQRVRIATINASLYAGGEGQLLRQIIENKGGKAKALASIVQTVRPDVLLINEIDYDAKHRCPRTLNKMYFAEPQKETNGIEYNHIYCPPVNTGVPSAMDLDNDGKSDGAADSWGFGNYPGQYGMAVLSRFPIDENDNTFQKFLWSSLRGALRPSGDFYSDSVWQKLRLSSKNHCDVPIRIGNQTLHFLISHPTPPVFDGPEDRNGRRNHDEIAFWRQYISGDVSFGLKNDRGKVVTLAKDACFVIAGDMNADPIDGSGRTAAIRSLLEHPRVIDPKQSSDGAIASARREGKRNLQHRAPHRTDTGEFYADAVGNLRVDYVLPSSNVKVVDSGVFWPESDKPAADWVKVTDHRMVWVDIEFQ